MPLAAFNAYRYLNKHDRTWLDDNPVPTRNRGGRALDWDARDREWADQARAIIETWRQKDTQVRVNWWTVGSALRKRSVIMHSKGRLPRLAAVIGVAIDGAGTPDGDRFYEHDSI